MPSTSCVGEDLSMPVGIADCCADGESCLALGCGRDERGKLKSCEGELKSRGCSVPSTSCVGEGLSVPVCIADGCAGGVSGRTLGCGREDRGELRSCEGELSFSRGGVSSASSAPCHQEARSVVMSRWLTETLFGAFPLA